MTAREHGAALREKATRAADDAFLSHDCDYHYDSGLIVECSCGSSVLAQNHLSQHLAGAVLDAVADDIARAERERVLAEFEAKAATWRHEAMRGAVGGFMYCGNRLDELVARLRGGEGRG